MMVLVTDAFEILVMLLSSATQKSNLLSAFEVASKYNKLISLTPYPVALSVFSFL